MSNKTYGGIIFTDDHRVVLVEPTNHFSGLHWTFPKGGIDKGETEEQAALREVLEETGYVCKIIFKIDGVFHDNYGTTEYFAMRIDTMSGERNSKYDGKRIKYMAGETDAETATVAAATMLAAVELLKKSTGTSERDKNLKVLKQAYEQYDVFLMQ